ncbi:hypothetical protein LUZ60_005243 [Juncus effusus]|nr:hypothetical protein LUZ60_005243 [Juncus effusus]
MAFKNVLLVGLFMAIVAMESSPLVAGQLNFTVIFDVSRGPIGSYNDLIRNLRQRVANPGQYTRTIPMLQMESPGLPGQWFHLVLQNGPNVNITMRIRMDNMYFDAFRVGNSNQWWEFGQRGTPIPLIAGSRFMFWEGRYESMGSLTGTYVGPDRLRDAVTALTVWDGTPARQNATKEACIQLIFMISEAIRFQSISNFVYDLIHTGNNVRVTAAQNDLVHAWGGISGELIQSDRTATFSEFSRFGINFAAQAAAVLGLVLVENPNRRSNNRLLSADATGIASPGRKLLEIYYLQVLNIDGENPGDLYGTVQVIDDVDTPVYIYNRISSNSESLRPNEYATLTGPSRALSALDSFTIDISLMDYDATSSDDEVGKGQIGWNYYDVSNVYNQPISEVIKGQYGSVAIGYAVFTNAVAAIVQVTLVNGDGENPANVYGTIKSATSAVPTYINLFNRVVNKNYVDVKPQTLIPLNRSVVVVPLGSSLKIVADLWDYDTLSSDDAIAQGSATFLAQNTGDVTSSIKGQYGEISVKISWSSNWK